MTTSWYKNSMPKIKDVSSFLVDLSKTISKIKGVKCVYAFGSYAKNISDQNFPLRDIDIVVANKFFSEDLLSITDNSTSPFKMSSEALEEEGFNPDAVNFTKLFITLKQYNLDHWAISGDNKLLHWGPIVENKQEWDEIKKEAEEYADFTTGIKREDLYKVAEVKRDRWRVMHDHHINKFLSGIPNGWYQSEYKAKDILKECVKI